MRPHWLPWIEEGFDAFIQLGAHATAATPHAVLCHSMELDIVSMTLNGQTVGEIGLATVDVGWLNIPTVLVTGGQAAVDEMQVLVPQCEGVAVKRGLSRGLARHLAPARARQLIPGGTTRALQWRAEIPPYRLEPPFALRITYVAPVAKNLARKTDLEAVVLSPCTIEYRSDDMIQLVKLFE
jgi:D-amino peptidase